MSLLLATVLLAAVLTACGSDEAEVPAAPDAASEVTVESPPDVEASGKADKTKKATKERGGAERAAVPEALDFSATTVTGDDFTGASVAGRPVVLWFWAPWCAVCRSQVPMVTGFVDEYGEDLAVLGVGSLDSESAIAGFADDAPGVTHLSDPDGELWKRFGIAEQSSFVVLDAAGEEVLRTGYADDGSVEDAVAGVAG